MEDSVEIRGANIAFTNSNGTVYAFVARGSIYPYAAVRSATINDS